MNESNKPTTEETTTSPTLEIRVEVFGRTDVGLVREHNEDNFLVADLTEGNRSIKPEVRNHRLGRKGSLFAVCDGMGGAAAGEVASRIAVDTIYDMMQLGDAATSEEALAQKLEKAICEAGRRILTSARLNRSQRGMGTTVTAATLIGPRLLIGQVGDSRAYILRGQRLVQVTKDQSLVQQLIDAKQMTEEEAKTFDKNNIILQALGTAEEVHVDVTTVLLKQGDRLIMCSDGLSGVVDNDAIREAVLETQNPMEACRILTEKACQGGGHDNITAIVAVFDGEDLAPPPPAGQADPELVYTRFTFSRSSETTARKMRPEKPQDRRDSVETTQPMEAVHIPRGPERISSVAPPPPRSPQKIWFAAAAILVSIIIVAVATTREEQEPPLSTPPPAAAATPPPEPPRPLMPVLKPPTPTPPTPEPTPAPTVEEEVPALAPTPEEAITKSKDDIAPDEATSADGEKKHRTGHRKKHSDKQEDESASTPTKEKASTDDDLNGAPTGDLQKEIVQPKEEAGDAAASKPAVPNDKPKPDPKNESAVPAPIDENPFASE